MAALDYSLAPASPFPAPLADCQQAFAYLRAHAAEWGCDSARVSVGGDSAGGNLALATALSVPGVNSVIPIYPVTELFTRRSHSWRKYGKGYGNDAELLEAFNEAYAQGAAAPPARFRRLVQRLRFAVSPARSHPLSRSRYPS